jgi:AsmA protein
MADLLQGLAAALCSECGTSAEGTRELRMKALRITVVVLAGVLVIAIVAAVVLVRTFDPNDYKDELTAYVQERTGRSLTIAEDIELSLFPWLAVETGGVALSDDERFGERSFVTVEALSARVRVWPLLRRRVEIGRVVLDGIDLNLAVDAEGRPNWQDLLQTDTAAAPGAEADARGAPAIEQLAVEGIALRNARIRWHDAAGEVRYVVSDLNLDTGRVEDDEPVELEIAFALLDVASQASAEINLSALASLAPEPALSRIEAELKLIDASAEERAAVVLTLDGVVIGAERSVSAGPATLSARIRRPPLGPEPLEIALAFAGLELDGPTGSLSVRELTTRTGGLTLDWSLSGDALFEAPSLSGTVAARGASLREVFAAVALPWPEALAADDGGAFAADSSFRLALDPLALELDGVTVRALDLVASAKASLDADRLLTAELTLPAARPSAPLLALLAPALPDGVDLGAVQTAGLDLGLRHALGSDRLELERLSLGVDAARLDGRLTLDGLAQASRLEGNITAAGLDDRLLAALFGPWLPADLLAAELGEFSLATGFSHDANAGVTAFEPLALEAYGLAASGELRLLDQAGALTLEGQAEIARFAPRALLARFDLPVPASQDPSAFASARLAAGFTTTGANGEFRDIVLELDDSRITGELAVENFADPAYRFVLRADRIDVDRYLPPPAEEAEPGERTVGDIAIASEPLTATRLTGTASVGELGIAGLSLQDVSTELAVGDGRGRLDSVRARLYGGEFAGRMAVDASGEAKRTELAGALENVALAPLLTALLGDAHLSGTGSIELDLAGTGDTIGDAMQTAAGTMSIALRNGRIDGFNLERTLCAAFNAADRLPAPPSVPELTAYTEIGAAASVSNGIASTSNLSASTGKVAVTGSGTMRLADQHIDFDLRARLLDTIAIERCERINSQVGGSFPFTLEGTLPDVVPKPDLSEYLRDRVREGVRERVEESILDRLRERF